MVSLFRAGRLAAAALVATSLVAVAGAQSAGSTRSVSSATAGQLPGWLPGVTESSRLGTSPLATGTVLAPTGTPLAGVPVHLELWPTVAELESMSERTHFDTVPVAKTTTDRSGRFTLKPDPDVLANVRGGPTDVTVGAWTAEWGTVQAHGTLEIGPGRRPDPVGAELRFDRPMRTQGSEIALMGHSCQSFKDLGKKWVNVGHVFIPGTRMTGRATYWSGASSTLGVGVSATGSYGSFSSSGTVTRERRSETGFRRTEAKEVKLYDTQFRYGKYCTTWHSPGPHTHYTVKAVNHAGGTRGRNVSAPVPPRKHCSSYTPGSYEVIDHSQAITWTNGAKLGSTIGIDLSSRTGFTSAARLRVNFLRSATRRKWLCGMYGDPAHTPRIVVARNKLPS